MLICGQFPGMLESGECDMFGSQDSAADEDGNESKYDNRDHDRFGPTYTVADDEPPPDRTLGRPMRPFVPLTHHRCWRAFVTKGSRTDSGRDPSGA